MQGLGLWGEALAARYLLARGHRILCRRYRTAYGEIDLVALSPGGRLRFVEVKTRRSRRYGRPEEAVSVRKLTRMRAAAARFLDERPPTAAAYHSVSFDVIAITVEPGGHVDLQEIRDVTG